MARRPQAFAMVARRIAAEHFAFADDARTGLRGVSAIAPAIVNNPFWDF